VFIFTAAGPDDAGSTAGLLKLDQLGKPAIRGAEATPSGLVPVMLSFLLDR
jgi:hypothetical protein